MTIRPRGLFSIFAIFALLLTACQHNPAYTPAQQTQVNLWSTLDVIAGTNRNVAAAIVSLNKQGQTTDALTRSVLGYNEQINNGVKAASQVLDSGQTPEAKANAIVNLLKTLDLPPPVKEFVNSNPKVAAVLALVNSIVSIQQQIARVAATPPALLSVAKGTP